MDKELEIFKVKKWQEVLKFLAAYLVASWTFLQFIDWILSRYNISPHWVDILLWLFIGIIPSIIIYLFHRDRINQRILKLREKIIFPTNLVLVVAILYFSFGSSDLGSTTKEISIINELGNSETQVITKEEFRIGLPIYNFKQTKVDSSNAWIGETINDLLKLDLNQNKSLSPSTNNIKTTVQKVEVSSVFYKYYVDGEYEVNDGVYSITPVLRNSKNGKEISRKTFKGEDFFQIIDDISNFLKDNLLLSEELRDQYLDLSIRDITTSSIEALKYWAEQEYEKATSIDDEFALAYYSNASRRTRYSHGELEEKYLIDKAYENRSKLPSQLQFEILMYRHIVYNQWKDAEELIRYQLEIEPNNENYNLLLYTIFSETKNFDAFYEHASKRFQTFKDESTAREYFKSLILKKDFKAANQLIGFYEILAPNLEEVSRIKGYTNLHAGDIKEAKKAYKKLKLRWPRESIYQNEIDGFLTKIEKEGQVNFKEKEAFGFYRSPGNEQQIEYFIKDNVPYVYYKNQVVNPALYIGENQLLSLNPGWVSGTKHTFEKDSLNRVYRIKVDQFSENRNTIFYYYKDSEDIRNALNKIKDRNFKNLDKEFQQLIKNYPKHWFLPFFYQHVQYMNRTDSKTLNQQFAKISGNYGDRKIWVEDGRIFYKRTNLTRVELLPISETRYINLSKFDTHYEFEFLNDGRIGSFVHHYDLEKNQWVRWDDKGNYLFKD